MDIRNLRRSPTHKEVLLSNMITVETYWNAFHIALFFGHLKIARFFFEDCRIDAASLGRLSDDTYGSIRTKNINYEAFPLFIGITAYNLNIFRYLWVENGFMWNEGHWKECLKLVEEKERITFFRTLFESETSHSIFTSLDFNAKVELMNFFVAPERKYPEKYAEFLKEQPYRWTYAVSKAKNTEGLNKEEVSDLKQISKSITKKEIETSKKEDDRVNHVETFLRAMTKLENNDEKDFKIFKSLTSKIIQKPEFEKFKAEDSEKVLTVISDEDEVTDEEEKSDADDSSDSELEFLSNAEFCQAAETGKLEKIKFTMKQEKFVDILEMIDFEKELTIDEEKHNTELWNALLFATNKNRMEVVKYFVEEGHINLRLALTNPEKREDEYDEEKFLEIDPEDELFGVEIALGNRNLDMFEYLWDCNYAVWTGEHFRVMLNKLIDAEWMEGLKIFMKAKVSHEIFISLPFSDKNKLFDNILKIVEDIEDEGDDDSDDEENQMKKFLLEAITESPYCMGMILYSEPNLKEHIKKAKGNFKDNEFHYIVFKDEVKNYTNKFDENKDENLTEALSQFNAFNETHFKIKLGEAVKTLMDDTKKENLEVFDSNPRFAHLNLHTKFNIDSKSVPKTFKKFNWNFLSLALLKKNTTLFNNLISKHKPLLGMLFKPSEKKFKDEKEREYKSQLQALTQHQNDLDVLFNLLENHSSLFTFEEVYYLIKNTLAHGSPSELKIMHSKTVKSWFVFISTDSKRKVRSLLIFS
jgi:hypothetical protein